MTSTELRYYLKMAKLLEISKEAALQMKVGKNDGSQLVLPEGIKLTIKGYTEAKCFLEDFLNVVDANEIWLYAYMYDAKDFGPMQVRTADLKNVIDKLLGVEGEIFTITSLGKNNVLEFDICCSDGDTFEVEIDIRGVSFINAYNQITS